MSIPQPDLFTNPNDLQRNTLQLQTRIVQIAWTDSWKIWNPGSSQIRPRFWHKYSWKWVLWANGQTGGGAKPALALDWIDLERFWQCKSLNWHLPESKKVCKYGATMHIEGSRSLWRKNYPSGGVRSSNWLSSQLENLTTCPPNLAKSAGSLFHTDFSKFPSIFANLHFSPGWSRTMCSQVPQLTWLWVGRTKVI